MILGELVVSCRLQRIGFGGFGNRYIPSLNVHIFLVKFDKRSDQEIPNNTSYDVNDPTYDN